MGCCLFAMLLAGAPRLAFVFMWVFRPVQTQNAFTSFWWALLGVLFMPWTALTWVFVYPGGVAGFDWLWIGIAVLIDVGTYVGNVRAKQMR